MIAARAACLLGALAWTACASGPAEPVVDLTPFAWTWTQASLGRAVIRYGIPSEPEAAAVTSAGALGALLPDVPGAGETRLASYRYDCARAGRDPDAACTVFLDFWLLELEQPLAGDLVRDSRGREWRRRTLALASGGSFAHYALPIDAGRALAVTSLTTRAPDRIAARDLARDAIDRVVIAPLGE